MKHLGLFEGIGGFSLAAWWMGWETVAWCEINPFCQRVLKYHFPNAKPFIDITKTDFTELHGAIDIITGGFPCQPYSVAGKRKGKEDERHLWPEMLRAIREVRPRWVVGENVSGLISWDGGLVFDEVQTDLEAEGYEVQPFVLPACAVNAPHRRDRVWFVAYSAGNGHGGNIGFGQTGRKKGESESKENKRERFRNELRGNDAKTFVANANHNGPHGAENRQSDRERINYNATGPNDAVKFEGRGDKAIGDTSDAFSQGLPVSTCRKQPGIPGKTETPPWSKFSGIYSAGNRWEDFPTQSPVRSRDDGFPAGLDGITFPKWRNESIKAYGNAIVPQVAYQIFKAIQEYETL